MSGASADRRAALLTGLASAATLGGVLLAVARPEWLTGPLQDAVRAGGPLAPVVYVLLCALLTPLHLGGVLVALSAVTWPLWQALALSGPGVALGGVLGFALLARAGSRGRGLRDAWPAWLKRAAESTERRPVPIGVLARLALGGGLALEAFFALCRYTTRGYALVLVIGSALYVAQTILGVTVLRALLAFAPGLAGVFALSPLLLVGAVALLRRRRTA